MLAALDVSQKQLKEQLCEHQLKQIHERTAQGSSTAVALAKITNNLTNMGGEILAIKEQQDIDRKKVGEVSGGLESQLASGRCAAHSLA